MAEKKQYGKWAENGMQAAIAACRNHTLGLNAAARAYNVPKATLKRRLDGKNKYAVGSLKKFGRSQDLPPEIENQLVEHILELERKLFGINRKDLMKLAFDIAEANDIPHRFKNGRASKKWYYGFMARHPVLSLRQPEPTSAARALGFSKEVVMRFYDVLTNIYDEHNFGPTSIYNVDETGLSTVQKPQKIISRKGKHQVGAITSGERGTNTTCVCCFNAAGTYIPPMMIFKRLRFKDELKEGAPPGTTFACSESGWITSELFVKWLKHFISFVKPNRENKVLLVLDGHTTHTKNLEAINLAREHGVIMLSLPPHTTHRLQPCDVSFFKPLSTYYNQAADKWLRSHPEQNITQFQVSTLLGEAYARAATVGNAINGFAKCGIWPLDRNVFQDHEFVCLETDANGETVLEDNPVEEHSEEPAINDISTSATRNSPSSSEQMQIDRQNPSTPEKQCSSVETRVFSDKADRVKPTNPVLSFAKISTVSPVPVLKRKPRARGSGSATIVTSTPYKEDLIARQQPQKKIKNRELSSWTENNNQASTSGKGKSVNKGCANKSAKESKVGPPASKKKRNLRSQCSSDSLSESDDEDCLCLYCFSKFSESKPREKWVKCISCKRWAHEACTSGKINFVCIHCNSDSE